MTLGPSPGPQCPPPSSFHSRLWVLLLLRGPAPVLADPAEMLPPPVSLLGWAPARAPAAPLTRPPWVLGVPLAPETLWLPLCGAGADGRAQADTSVWGAGTEAGGQHLVLDLLAESPLSRGYCPHLHSGHRGMEVAATLPPGPRPPPPATSLQPLLHPRMQHEGQCGDNTSKNQTSHQPARTPHRMVPGDRGLLPAVSEHEGFPGKKCTERGRTESWGF